MKMLLPQVNSIINDALMHVSPHVNQTPLQVVHLLDFCLLDVLLHYTPDNYCSQLGLGVRCLESTNLAR